MAVFVERQMQGLGFPDAAVSEALRVANLLADSGQGKQKVKKQLREVRHNPGRFLDDALFGRLANLLAPAPAAPSAPAAETDQLRARAVPHRIWGQELMDGATIDQFLTACKLPVAVAAAQMPDGHVGYGLPIGGVLATRDAVIPYAVGVDIACRMRLSICEEPLSELDRHRPRLKQALLDETRFGIGARFDRGDEREHEVMDDPAWRDLALLARLRDTAAQQLGTSGSGNHFVEFGELETAGVPELGLPAGTYLALLSHSGSRGLGAKIAEHYTKVAMARHPLPKPAQHLAWLGLDEADGQEYWRAMALAGCYAAANHALIHEHVLRAARLRSVGHVENHHNFAWLEEHDGEQVVVHRKGATPAGQGVLGVIPGSMGDPGYVVRGKGHPASLASAAHGAGRRMSRSQAKASLTTQQQLDYLKARGIELLAAGLDESPQAYKPIAQVMAAQDELVETVAEFRPKLVLMAGGGRAED